MIVTLDVNIDTILSCAITSRKAAARNAIFDEIRRIGTMEPDYAKKLYVDMTDYAYAMLELPEFENKDPRLCHVSPSFYDIFVDVDGYLNYFPNIFGFIMIDPADGDLLPRLKVAFSAFRNVRVVSSELNVYQLLDG